MTSDGFMPLIRSVGISDVGEVLRLLTSLTFTSVTSLGAIGLETTKRVSSSSLVIRPVMRVPSVFFSMVLQTVSQAKALCHPLPSLAGRTRTL